MAEREIIANAINHSPDFSPNHVQSYKDKSKQQRKWGKKIDMTAFTPPRWRRVCRRGHLWYRQTVGCGTSGTKV